MKETAAFWLYPELYRIYRRRNWAGVMQFKNAPHTADISDISSCCCKPETARLWPPSCGRRPHQRSRCGGAQSTPVRGWADLAESWNHIMECMSSAVYVGQYLNTCMGDRLRLVESSVARNFAQMVGGSFSSKTEVPEKMKYSNKHCRR